MESIVQEIYSISTVQILVVARCRDGLGAPSTEKQNLIIKAR
jgi:hypothetical protein